MAPADVTKMSDGQPVKNPDGTVDDYDYAVAATVLAVALVCVIIAVVVCSCCQRQCMVHPCKHCCPLCPCQKRDRGEQVLMGYIPANITVNSAAMEQGVPDIFLRESQSGRFSLDPYSQDSGAQRGNPDSPTETSGTWSEYLRRAVMFPRRSMVPERKVSAVEIRLDSVEPKQEANGKEGVRVDEGLETDVVNGSVNDDIKNGGTSLPVK